MLLIISIIATSDGWAIPAPTLQLVDTASSSPMRGGTRRGDHYISISEKETTPFSGNRVYPFHVHRSLKIILDAIIVPRSILPPLFYA